MSTYNPYAEGCRLATLATMLSARAIIDDTGVGMKIVQAEQADDTFDKLKHAFSARGLCLMVSNVGLEDSVYGAYSIGLGKTLTPAQVNAYARYWHDATHVEHTLPFNFFGELQAARMQMKRAAHLLHERGLSCTEILLALRVLWCDVAEQAIYFEENNGAFVPDQRAFVAERFAGSARAEQEALAVMGTVLFQRIQAGLCDA